MTGQEMERGTPTSKLRFLAKFEIYRLFVRHSRNFRFFETREIKHRGKPGKMTIWSEKLNSAGKKARSENSFKVRIFTYEFL